MISNKYINETRVFVKCQGWSAPCSSLFAVRYRMPTGYIDEERNYRNLCPLCQEECEEYWDEISSSAL